jgi:hypothetical protein
MNRLADETITQLLARWSSGDREAAEVDPRKATTNTANGA